MNTQQNTILITGGSAGIGMAIAKLFSENGNQVIITGRNEERLQKAAAQLKNVTAIQADVTKEEDMDKLVARVQRDFPALNILINNAGNAYVYKLGQGANAAAKASEEMLTNYLAPISLTEKLLPLLEKQPEAAVVNVSSIVAFAPGQRLPTYAASKAALHSYTLSLRLALEPTSVKVFELMPPLVDTEFSTEIGGANGIAPSVVAEDLFTAFENNTYQIHVGRTADLYQLSLASPAEALLAMNPKQPA